MTLLRSALFNVWFFLVTLILCSYGILVRLFAPQNALQVAQRWARWSLAGARVICGIRVEVSGREHLPSMGPALVASQHQSAFDTLVWLWLVPRASYVVKAELGRIPLFGSLLQPGGQILVDRSAGAAALRQLLHGADRAAAEGRTIVIFPEGTRVEHGTRVPLRPGIAVLANRLRLPVLPVATDSGKFWGRRAFRKHPGTIRIVIGPPIAADLPRAQLISELEAAWSTLLPQSP